LDKPEACGFFLVMSGAPNRKKKKKNGIFGYKWELSALQVPMLHAACMGTLTSSAF